MGYRLALDPYPTQHLVLDQHHVAGVEELAVLEKWVADLLGSGVEGPMLPQNPGLAVVVSVHGHLLLAREAVLI